MQDRSPREELPLLSRTPDAWAAIVLRDPLALLSDHAYLEKKAAANALELLNRWPEPLRPEEWTQTLAAIASDEASHLNGVIRLLTERGGRLEPRTAMITPVSCGRTSAKGAATKTSSTGCWSRP